MVTPSAFVHRCVRAGGASDHFDVSRLGEDVRRAAAPPSPLTGACVCARGAGVTECRTYLRWPILSELLLAGPRSDRNPTPPALDSLTDAMLGSVLPFELPDLAEMLGLPTSIVRIRSISYWTALSPSDNRSRNDRVPLNTVERGYLTTLLRELALAWPGTAPLSDASPEALALEARLTALGAAVGTYLVRGFRNPDIIPRIAAVRWLPVWLAHVQGRGDWRRTFDATVGRAGVARIL